MSASGLSGSGDGTSFFVSDIDEWDEGPYDAVFGRRVLMYQPDALATVEAPKGLFRPEDLMVFQGRDEGAPSSTAPGRRRRPRAAAARNGAWSCVWNGA